MSNATKDIFNNCAFGCKVGTIGMRSIDDVPTIVCMGLVAKGTATSTTSLVRGLRVEALDLCSL